MNELAGDYPYTMSIKIPKSKNYKIGDTVTYKGDDYKILRIDGHVYPICLGGGIRVNEKMLGEKLT